VIALKRQVLYLTFAPKRALPIQTGLQFQATIRIIARRPDEGRGHQPMLNGLPAREALMARSSFLNPTIFESDGLKRACLSAFAANSLFIFASGSHDYFFAHCSFPLHYRSDTETH